jgi:hypothetical protein
MVSFQGGPLSDTDLELIDSLYFGQHTAQGLPSDQWLEPNTTDSSRLPTFGFTFAHPPGFSLEPQVQSPPTNSPCQQKEHHTAGNLFSSQPSGNLLLPPSTTYPDWLFVPEVQTPLNNPPYQQEEHHPIVDPFSMEPTIPQDVVRARTQGPTNAESRSGSSSSGNASPAGAATIAPHSTAAVSSSQNRGLQFTSYADAFATVDSMFLDHVNVKASNEDIAEVEQNPKYYVKLLVDALKYDGHMEAEEFRTTMTGVKKPSTASDKQEWDDWQEEILEVVDGHFEMPNVEARIEWIAWATYEEILKVHRTGFRYTTLRADRKSKCSQRVVLVVRATKSTAMVRQRILEGCDLSDLAAGPSNYASSTARNRRNNSSRATTTATSRRRRSRSAKVTGAIAERYMTRKEILRRKDEEREKEDGDGNEDGDGDGDVDGPGGDEDDDDNGDEEEGGTFAADDQQPPGPSAPPTSRPSYQHTRISPSQPTQMGSQRLSSIPHSSNDRFGGNSNPAAHFMPRNYATNDEPRQSQDLGFSFIQPLNTNRVGYHDGNLNWAMQFTQLGATNPGNSGNVNSYNPTGGLSNANQQAPHDTLHDHRRRSTQVTDSAAAVTNAGPAQPLQTPDNMPGEDGRKRRTV